MPCVEVLTDFCRMAKPASAAADSLRPAAMVILRCSSLRASFWAFIAFAHFSMSCKEQNHSGTHKLVLTTLISFTWNTVVTFRHKPFIIFTPSYVLRIFVSFICPKNTSSEMQIMISTFPNDLLLKARLDHPPPSPLHQYTHKSNLPPPPTHTNLSCWTYWLPLNSAKFTWTQPQSYRRKGTGSQPLQSSWPLWFSPSPSSPPSLSCLPALVLLTRSLCLTYFLFPEWVLVGMLTSQHPSTSTELSWRYSNTESIQIGRASGNLPLLALYLYTTDKAAVIHSLDPSGKKNANVCTLYICTVIAHRIKPLEPSKSLVLGKKISLQKTENIFRKLKSKGPSTIGVYN